MQPKAVFALVCVCTAVVLTSASASKENILDKNHFYYCGGDLTIPSAPEGATLKQVSVLIRHGDRTRCSPGTCWGNDNAVYTCDNETQLMRTKTPNTSRPAYAFNKYYMRGRNLLPGTCMLGQLTNVGFKQHINNGQALRDAYVERAGLLPKQLNSDNLDSFFLRSDDCPRTIQSGQALVSGMYADSDVNVALIPWATMDSDTDNIEPSGKVCPRYAKVEAAIKTTKGWTDHINKVSNPLLKEVNQKLGTNQDNISFVMDCFYTHICHNHPVPDAVDEDLVNRVTADAAWHTNYVAQQPQAAKYGMGPLVGEVTDAMKDAVSGNHDSKKFLVYSGHDTGPMLPWLMAFSQSAPVDKWVPYASNIILELYKMDHGSHAVRALYLGKPFLMKGCSDVLCPWEEYVKYADSLTPTQSECDDTTDGFGLEPLL